MKADLDDLRRRIDLLDESLVKLLNARAACALEIGRIKQRAGLPIYSPEREAQIFERLARDNPGPLDRVAVRRVFERIIDESRRLERLGSSSAEQAADAAAEGRERRD